MLRFSNFGRELATLLRPGSGTQRSLRQAGAKQRRLRPCRDLEIFYFHFISVTIFFPSVWYMIILCGFRAQSMTVVFSISYMCIIMWEYSFAWIRICEYMYVYFYHLDNFISIINCEKNKIYVSVTYFSRSKYLYRQLYTCNPLELVMSMCIFRNVYIHRHRALPYLNSSWPRSMHVVALSPVPSQCCWLWRHIVYGTRRGCSLL